MSLHTWLCAVARLATAHRLLWPSTDDITFDTELVSHKIQDLKRGKAADTFGLSITEHLFSHRLLSTILSELFWSTEHIPDGFKYNYI